MRVATSPGGPGHDWVRERFAIDNPASVLPLGRRVLTATMADNPHLEALTVGGWPTCCRSPRRCVL